MSEARRDMADARDKGRKPAVKAGKKNYTVTVEPVLQEKKTLRSLHTMNIEPPTGYTYLEIGTNVDLTELCKDLSRENDSLIYIVSPARNDNTHFLANSISHHVNRIGYHFSCKIVNQAKNARSASGSVEHDLSAPSKRTSSIIDADGIINSPRTEFMKEDIAQRKRDQQVRDTILELFPQIPGRAMEAIVRRAFAEGTGKVGNAKYLTLAKRVQLAVVAHIRHAYTPYDRLLKSTRSKPVSRRLVEDLNLEHVLKWRGEDTGGQEKAEIEKYLREVIVIDDDEDDDEHLGCPTGLNLRQPSSFLSAQGGIRENTRYALDQSTEEELYRPAYPGSRQPTQVYRSVEPLNHDGSDSRQGVKRRRSLGADTLQLDYGREDSFPRVGNDTRLGLVVNDDAGFRFYKPEDDDEEATGVRSIHRALHTLTEERFGNTNEYQTDHDGYGLSYHNPIVITSAVTSPASPQLQHAAVCLSYNNPIIISSTVTTPASPLMQHVAMQNPVVFDSGRDELDRSHDPTKHLAKTPYTYYSRTQNRIVSPHDYTDQRVTPYLDDNGMYSQERLSLPGPVPFPRGRNRYMDILDNIAEASELSDTRL